MGSTRYYVGSGDHAKGPYTLQQLREAVQETALAPSVLVRAEGETEGRPLGQLLTAAPPVLRAPAGLSEEEQALRRVFCEPCLASSTSQSPGNMMSINGIGRSFYGNAEKCPRCGATVRVLWFILGMFPVLPLGSYRCRQASQELFRERFIARLTHTRWPQVFTHWAVALTICSALYVAILYALHR